MKIRTFFIFSLTLVASIASASQFDTKFTGGIDTTISHIASGGLWEHGENYGRLRLIVRNLGWEHSRSFLYLQWLQVDDDKKEVVELKTAPIQEFNKGNWRNVVRVEYANNSFIIYYTLRAQKGIQKAFLIPELPYKYSITFNST